MFHLVRMNLPYWELLDSNSDEDYLEEMCVESDLDVVDDEGLKSIKQKYPQVRGEYT